MNLSGLIPAPTTPRAVASRAPLTPLLTAVASDVCRNVLQLLSSRLGMEICLLSVEQDDTYVVVEVIDPVCGLQPGPLGPWAETICAQMADGRGPVIAPVLKEIPAYRRIAERQGLPIRSYAGVALRTTSGELLGSLCAFSLHERGAELRQQYDLLSTFGLVLSQVLERELNAQQSRTAEVEALEQARTDTLTGLLNRRGWQGVLQEVDRWCRREEETAAVFVVDLDELKTVNDRDGHDAGDALLQRAARALSDVVRDLMGTSSVVAERETTPYAVARTGGDEFAVVLTRADSRDCPAVAGQLRRSLTDAGVSASLGFAMRHPVRGLALACRDADQVMLVDKRTRRTRRLPAPRGSSDSWRAGATELPSEPPAQAVGRLLERVRGLFGLESAFVSRFDESVQTFTFINTAVPLPIAVGDTRPSSISICRQMLDGVLPSVITDATQHAECAQIDVVQAGLVRTYLSVPVTLPDGRLYGTLCCLSARTRPDITDTAAAALAFAAEQVGELLGREQAAVARHDRAASRLELLLTSGGLRVALQPVVDLRTGRTIGVEALARFDDGRTPDEWFGEAARAGLSERLELAAFDAALVVAATRTEGFLAVNLSPAVLLSAPFTDRLEALVGAPGNPLSRLVIELTEHEQVSDYGALSAAMGRYRAHGLRLAVDDTGAGHSSLSHVLQLRPDVMKLDRQLVTALDRDPIRRALVKSLRHFCVDAHIDLVAEGVETAQEAMALRAIGVTLAQGFHLGRPALPVAV